MLLFKTFNFLQNIYHEFFTKKEGKTAFLVENYTQTGSFSTKYACIVPLLPIN